jgi:hypothetical protein
MVAEIADKTQEEEQARCTQDIDAGDSNPRRARPAYLVRARS